MPTLLVLVTALWVLAISTIIALVIMRNRQSTGEAVPLHAEGNTSSTIRTIDAQQLSEALDSIRSVPGLGGLANGLMEKAIRNSLSHLVAQSPPHAIVQAWEMVEAAMNKRYESIAGGGDTRGALSDRELIEWLTAHDDTTASISDDLRGLEGIRTGVAKDNTPVTRELAGDYVDKALHVARRLMAASVTG